IDAISRRNYALFYVRLTLTFSGAVNGLTSHNVKFASRPPLQRIVRWRCLNLSRGSTITSCDTFSKTKEATSIEAASICQWRVGNRLLTGEEDIPGPAANLRAVGIKDFRPIPELIAILICAP